MEKLTETHDGLSPFSAVTALVADGASVLLATFLLCNNELILNYFCAGNCFRLNFVFRTFLVFRKNKSTTGVGMRMIQERRLTRNSSASRTFFSCEVRLCRSIPLMSSRVSFNETRHEALDAIMLPFDVSSKKREKLFLLSCTHCLRLPKASFSSANSPRNTNFIKNS